MAFGDPDAGVSDGGVGGSNGGRGRRGGGLQSKGGSVTSGFGSNVGVPGPAASGAGNSKAINAARSRIGKNPEAFSPSDLAALGISNVEARALVEAEEESKRGFKSTVGKFGFSLGNPNLSKSRRATTKGPAVSLGNPNLSKNRRAGLFDPTSNPSGAPHGEDEEGGFEGVMGSLGFTFDVSLDPNTRERDATLSGFDAFNSDAIGFALGFINPVLGVAYSLQQSVRNKQPLSGILDAVAGVAPVGRLALGFKAAATVNSLADAAFDTNIDTLAGDLGFEGGVTGQTASRDASRAAIASVAPAPEAVESETGPAGVESNILGASAVIGTARTVRPALLGTPPTLAPSFGGG